MIIKDEKLEPFFIEVDKHNSYNIYRKTDVKPFKRSIASKPDLISAMRYISEQKIALISETDINGYIEKIIPLKNSILEISETVDVRIKTLETSVFDLLKKINELDIKISSKQTRKGKRKSGGVANQIINNKVETSNISSETIKAFENLVLDI